MTILMILGSSQIGGAEKQFIRTVNEISKHRSIAVCVLGKKGPMREKLQDEFGEIYASDGNLLSDFLTILKAMKNCRPSKVVTWLYRADVLGAIVSRLCNLPCIISARNTNWPNSSYFKRKILKLTSNYLATSIVSNSVRASRFHEAIGYPKPKMRLIRNFIDIVEPQFKPLDRLGIKLGLAARAALGKGHFEAVQAFRVIRDKFPNSQLSLIGPNLSEWNDLIRFSQGLEVEIISGNSDVRNWFKGLDVFLALSTLWESDSNSAIESVMHGIPVITSPLQAIEDISDQMFIADPNSPYEVLKMLQRIVELPNAQRMQHLTHLRNTLIENRNAQALCQQWLDLL